MPTEVFNDCATGSVTSGATTAPAGGTVETWTVNVSAAFPALTSGYQFHGADEALPGEVFLITVCPGGTGVQTWTATRGADSTTPVAHASPFTVVQVIPASWLNGVAGGSVASVFGRTGAVTATSGDYTVSEVTGAAPLASPALTGTPTAPTQSGADNSTKLATTAYVTGAVGTETTRAGAAEALLAPKASPALTGTPTAPTASALTASTQLATTAYADSAVGAETSRAGAAEALKLAIAQNLADLQSASAARTNLGLTAAATALLPLSLANGGTGQTAQQAAMDALAGAQTSAQYLRGNGTHVVLAAIQAGDVPGFDGVTVTGTPSTGQVPTATSSSAATWQTPSLPVVTFTYGSTGAAPSSGTYTAGTAVVDQNNIVRVCTSSGTPGTWQRDGALPSQFWVEDYGALGNGRVVGDGAMTSSTATLTSATASFTSGDVGKNIIVNGALGASNAPLYTTVLSVTNSTTAVLNANATNTVTNAAAFLASDDSAAIVLCINAASAYAQANNWTAQVLFRAKSYGLATLTTTAASGSVAQQNALVPIPYPNVNGTTPKLIFELTGVGESANEQYLASTIPSMVGTCLVATVAASGTTPSIIGGPSASTGLTGTWANVKAVIRGISVWAGWNPGWIGFDLHQCASVWADNAAAQVLAPNGGGQNPGLGVTPTNSSGWGIIMPSNNDAGAGRLMVEGYYQGVGVSPRTTIEKLFTTAAAVGAVARTVNATVVHGARIGYWSCQNVTTAIKSVGTSGTMPLVIDLFDSAGTITTDVSDANGTLVGSVNWYHDVSAGPNVAAGFALKITNLKVNPGPMSSPPAAPSSGSASTAIFKDTEVTLSLSGGTLTALTIDSVDQHIPASCVLWKFFLPSGHTFTPTYTGALANDVTVR